ncbi:hypothetical protein EI42_04178 [Thermosporothrix hazakensis]|jgi:hypothetical protein|uniref:Uncharacterized protein n=1 Tax=Thermosporothrix hazakensis TaxID=644383 RepID=A0A326UBX2_THEHA|nr:hypothetical protein [Thermosporothrix hazakensis]PZW25685.1 hypothetical protein EI42_04178 [Thermosporothrix hazakensis]GCE48180.1 hypothetical protein KTH_30490 [Thermosporothrix hazakensis]
MAQQQQELVARQEQALPALQTEPERPPASRGVFPRFRFWMFRTFRGRLVMLASIILLLSLFLSFFSLFSLRRLADNIGSMGQNSVPGTDAAQAMERALSELDAYAASYLFTPVEKKEPCTVPGASGSPGTISVQECNERNIDASIALFNQELINASHHLVYPGERVAIERITTGFEQYTGYLAIMRQEYAQAEQKGNPNDPHMQKVQQAYHSAGQVLYQQIEGQLPQDAGNAPACTVSGKQMPAAQWTKGGITTALACLSSINIQEYKTADQNSRGEMYPFMLVICTLAGLLILCLLFASIWLLFVTHRVLQPAVNVSLIGTAVLSVFLGLFLLRLGGVLDGDYDRMTQFGYARKLDAMQTQLQADWAQAAEMRWLAASAYNDQKQAKHWSDVWQQHSNAVQIWFQNDRTLVYWPDEQKPVTQADEQWKRYLSLHKQLQTGNAQQIHDAALSAQTDAAKVVRDFDQATSAYAAANHHRYAETFAVITQGLERFILLSTVLFPLFGLLAAGGILIRLRDL